MFGNSGHSSAAIRSARHALRRQARPAVDPLESRELLSLLGQQLFPSDNPWNQKISSAPVASSSAAIMNSIINLYGNGRFHPDFGQDTQSNNPLYGIPFNVVHGNSVTKIHVVIDDYASESDLQNAPVPPNAVLEGDNQNGPVVGLNNRGDSHLIVWDEDNNVAYEFYNASRPSENSDGLWHAAQESVWDMKTDTFRTLDWTSADAAGLAILPGLVRPDEARPVSEGGQGVINHAIRITLQNNIILDQFLYPASHIANSGNNPAVQPPMGARLRLKASVDISQLNPESKVIAQAMKDYGVIVADNGSNFFASGASYSVDASNNFALTWNDNDIQDSTHGLKSLTYSNFEVVNLTPAVSGLSNASSAAGSSITVTGSNFSGAAGHLQVDFGTAAATNVTVVDDSHVTAVVPAGTGTVDVRVQSGVTAADTENINNPVFGYGTSAVTTADRFTYGGSTGNQVPTVAQPARATPNPVTGATTKLSVLGADDGGEANLVYTWQVTAAPTGASPSFSGNGTTAAKNTVVTFDRVGGYTFQVTIADTGGLTATSSVNVTVNQVFTSIVVTPSTVTLAFRARQQFSAQALDQFIKPLATQPSFAWSKFSGRGSITRTGLYTAPSSGPGTAVIQAKAGGKTGKATISVVARARAAHKIKTPSAAQSLLIKPSPHQNSIA
jgi:IPT/TIG domain